MDKSTQRVIAVIALLVVAAWALRGYIPGSEPIAEREPPTANPAATAVVIVMLCAAVAIIALAIVVRIRDRKPRRPPGGALPRSSERMGRPTWRFSLIALAGLIAWLLLVSVLSGIERPTDPPAADPPAASESSTPAPDREAPPPDPPADPASDSNVVGYLIPPMLVLMALVVVATVIASRRHGHEPQYVSAEEVGVPATPATADSLARAAEVGLAAIGDLSREPRDAIIACYAAMERELTRVPGAVPQDCDTPSEVLARAVDRNALRADSATELVELFEEARFSPHVMTETHRDAAVRVLERVLAELPQTGSVA